MRLDLSRLESVRRQSDQSIICACPVCRQEGHDRTGNHLRVYKTGQFNCILHSGERQHNRAIRAYLMNTALDENPEIEYIDPEPAIKTDKVYPESSLSSLIPDYTYWLGRGVTEDVCRRLEIGVAAEGEKSKLAGRSILPIRGLDGRLTGFSGRLLKDNSFAPKYKHLFKSSLAVYPWHIAGPHIKASRTVVLTEGVSDMMILMSHGIPNVLSLFGLNINGKIISTLVGANVRRIVISLNRDDDPNKGQRAAEKIANKLSVFFGDESIIIRLPPEGRKDWGECDADQIATFRQEINS